MLFLAENLKKYRILKNLTQEDVAEYLNITPQSVSKWERNESYPDITFLPALANIFETSIDVLVGMDTIRAEETRYNIHKTANALQRAGDYHAAEKGLGMRYCFIPTSRNDAWVSRCVLALQGNTEEAIVFIEGASALHQRETEGDNARSSLFFISQM